jgi:hypothetical protein
MEWMLAFVLLTVILCDFKLYLIHLNLKEMLTLVRQMAERK